MDLIYTQTDNFGIIYEESLFAHDMHYLHTHSTYEIYYLHEGKRSYIINNKVYELSSGCFALVPPNVFHKTKGDKYKRTLIYFSHSMLERSFKKNVLNQMLSCFESPIISIPESEHQYFNELSRRMTNCSFDNELPVLVAALLELLNKYKKYSEYTLPSENSNRLLSNILDYISRNFKTIENLDEIAEKFFITKFYLCRIFKEHTGMTVFQYLNILKIQLACTMLSDTDFSITDICVECGFKSHGYFCNVFQKQLGMTPSQYRKTVKNSRQNSLHS